MSWGVIISALVVAAGAGFKWRYEKHITSWDKYDPDRLVRLAFPIAVVLAFTAWPIYEAYDYMRPLRGESRHPPVWWWFVLIVAVLVPYLAGELAGRWRSNRLKKLNNPERSEGSNQSEKVKKEYPTSFDYMMDASRQGDPPLLYIQTKEISDQEWVAIGFQFHASVTPYIRDIYLEPVYFHGPKKRLNKDKLRSIMNPESRKPIPGGLLIHTDDVVFIRVLYDIPNKQEAANEE